MGLSKTLEGMGFGLRGIEDLQRIRMLCIILTRYAPHEHSIYIRSSRCCGGR